MKLDTLLKSDKGQKVVMVVFTAMVTVVFVLAIEGIILQAIVYMQ